jgi:MoaA/NifB/PqqE/SkfB family radical SAM enzyme
MKEPRQMFVRGAARALVLILLKLTVLGLAWAALKNPTAARQALRRFRDFAVAVRGTRSNRIVVFRRRVYWSLHAPSWPGRAFNAFAKDMLLRLAGRTPAHRQLATLIFAITKKCRYACEHCYAGNWVNGKDTLSLDDLKRIMWRFQANGVWQIQLSGGEPMLRAEDVLALLRASRGRTSFQLLTTGDGLTPARAIRLREAGLTGVVVSLDHWDPGRHNAFRKNEAAYDNAVKAAASARAAGLMVSLSLCPTKDFLRSEANLWRYFDLARSLGASFVRLLEPMREGNYAAADVRLGESERSTLERFFRKANADRAFRRHPVVVLPAYHERRAGCLGAGGLFVDVDADGNVNPCPFRQIRAGNCLTEDIDAIIARMRQTRCDCGYVPMFG